MEHRRLSGPGSLGSNDWLVAVASLPRGGLGSWEQRTGALAIDCYRNPDVAEHPQRAETDIERRLERLDHRASKVDTSSWVTVGDEREVARAEVTEVVFGCQLAEPVRDFTQQFLDAGSAVDLGDAAQLNHLNQDRGDLGVAWLRGGSAGECTNEALLVDRQVGKARDRVVQGAAAQFVEDEGQVDQVTGMFLQRSRAIEDGNVVVIGREVGQLRHDAAD